MIQLDPKRDRALLKKLQANTSKDSPRTSQEPICGTARRKSTREPDSSRQYTLDRLARSGWTCYCYDHATGAHWFRNVRTGATSPQCADYDAAIDAAKEMSRG